MFDSLDNVGMLELTNLPLKLEIEVVHLLMMDVMAKVMVMVTWWKLSQPEVDSQKYFFGWLVAFCSMLISGCWSFA